MTENFNKKMRQVIAEAVAGLDPGDRDERIAYCRENDEHGVRALVDGDAVVFSWGGRRLALVERELLTDDEAELPAIERLADGTSCCGQVVLGSMWSHAGPTGPQRTSDI